MQKVRKSSKASRMTWRSATQRVGALMLPTRKNSQSYDKFDTVACGDQISAHVSGRVSKVLCLQMRRE